MSNVNPCQNDGVCIPKLDGKEYTCECKLGFTGPNCKENIDDCKMNQCGENGQCIDLVNGYVCLCDSTHYGENCFDKSKHLNFTNGWPISIQKRLRLKKT